MNLASLCRKTTGILLTFAMVPFTALGATAQEATQSASACVAGTNTYEQCLPDASLAKAVATTANADADAVITTDAIESLTSLNARHAGIKDLTGLDTFTNLTTVQLSNNDIVSLAPLSALTKLTELELYGNLIADLTPLSALTALTKLGLGDNELTDVTPLAPLTSLVTLNLSHNGITSIDALGNMTSLEYLWASGNEISNADVVNKLTALKGGDLSTNGVLSAANITSDPEEYLVMTGQVIKTAVTVKHGDIVTAAMPIGYDGKPITPMGIDNNGVFDTSTGLVSWQTTTDMYSGITFIARYESQGGGKSSDRPFSGRISVKVVFENEEDMTTDTGVPAQPRKHEQVITQAVATTCDGTTTIADCFPDKMLAQVIAKQLETDVAHVITVDELDAITEIDADNAGITTLSGVEHLKNLKTVHLSDNQISDLTPLRDCEHLYDVRLYNASVSDVSPLANKTELWGIGLGNNFIKDFSTMTNVPKLGWADIYSNLIEDVSFIEQWPNCGSIWLSGNPFTDVSPLARATWLDRLQLENNAISDMSPFADFSPKQYSMNDNQGINMGDVTVDAGGEVTVSTAKGRAGGYLRPKKISPEGGVYDAATGTVTWKDVSDNGVYSVKFSESDDRDYLYSGIVYRNVTVEHADKTPPEISGVFPTYSTLGEPYDPLFGVQAHDDVDGDITNRITVPLNEVDINKEGTYRVRYYVEDSAHNGSWSGRKVTVTTATISSIKVWPKWTDPGVAPDMGNYAEATWSDGNVTGEGVVWDKIDPKLYATPGNTFTVHGKVRGRDVSTTVTVRGEAPTIAVESVAISGDGLKDGAITLRTGDTVTLKATVKPDDATKKTVSWSSSSNYIASVDGEGKVTANKVGTATITASAGGKNASVTLTIPDRFSDVPNGKAFHDEIEWLAANKISQGNSDGTYGYGKTLSRQDMAIFLYRMAKLEKIEGAESFIPTESDYKRFADVE